ncbi:SPX-domain-containing protein [Gymnopus androsaceus JB14]|uniref:SPX-domain-containing protein n=1 Tax=Gymnopus androsaceus JB14 TaxID=1447944 RepID=A0A6A4GZQ6_9AGAR|nr:SPX-domain-containing protein [Gymnopus androsaceus JB14]
MKFSSALKFNAVSEWWEEYISYDNLKKYIYQLEKQQQQSLTTHFHDLESNERTSLVGRPSDRATDSIFIPLLDKELEKITLFYENQEKELFEELQELEALIQKQEDLGLEGDHYADDGEYDEEDDESISRSPERQRRRRLSGSTSNHNRNTSIPENIWTARTNYAYDTRLLFKRRITNLYIAFTSIRSYVEVNYSGFRKILKKYDKVTYSELKDHYLHDVVEADSKDRLNGAVDQLVDLYTKCVARGNRSLAKQQLKLHQRENIAWERDTVWRQMIGRERRGEGPASSSLGATLVKEPELGLFSVPTPFGRLAITRRIVYLIIALVVFVVLLNVQVVEDGEANRCFAVLVFCTILWATEPIPLFVTSILVPLLLVCLKVVRGPDDEHMSAPNRYQTAILITRVLSFAGTKPSTVLLAFMCVSCFASMWISNVAAPTLCFTLIRPILRTLPPKTSFAPALILGIALAANIGGQSSPISSPQNLIALDNMDVPLDWGSWFAVALPVSAISILLIWGLLLASYRPSRSPDGESEIEIRPIRATKEPFTYQQYWVSFVCLATIALWCIAHSIDEYIGDMGVIAIIPIIAFFSTGILKKDDFEQFAWTIVFLAMGGIALGKGVTSSGLLDIMGELIRDLVQDFELYSVVLILSPIVLIISTFISHTIASVLLAPIAKQVASHLEGNPQNLLIFVTALICSAGMGMPVSGFPNQTAATQEDDLGELYLSNIDFLKNGIPASIFATLVVATVGYLLMRAIGRALAWRAPAAGYYSYLSETKYFITGQ